MEENKFIRNEKIEESIKMLEGLFGSKKEVFAEAGIKTEEIIEEIRKFSGKNEDAVMLEIVAVCAALSPKTFLTIMKGLKIIALAKIQEALFEKSKVEEKITDIIDI